MSESLAQRFEQDRSHLRCVAYRMLGSLSDADDAVQETWLRLARTDAQEVANLSGWLTTVVARVSLDMLRSRSSRAKHEAPTDNASVLAASASTPEQATELAHSVGLALLVVLEKLEPVERVAFVLHDMFSVPFDEIAEIVGKTPDATRQLASRARRRVQGAPTATAEVFAEQRETVGRFITALRTGDFDGMLAVLAPDVQVTIGPRVMQGAAAWAKGAVHFAREAAHMSAALVDGNVGILFAPAGQLSRALRVTVANGKITAVDIVTEHAALEALDVATLP